MWHNRITEEPQWNDIVSFGTSEPGNHHSSFDMGFKADTILNWCFQEVEIEWQESLPPLVWCQVGLTLVALCMKLPQETPVKYPLAIALTCVDPGNMAATPEQCRIMTKLVLVSCLEPNHVSETDCDDILMQFSHQTPKSELENFNKRMIDLTHSFREMWQAFTQGLDYSRVCKNKPKKRDLKRQAVSMQRLKLLMSGKTKASDWNWQIRSPMFKGMLWQMWRNGESYICFQSQFSVKNCWGKAEAGKQTWQGDCREYPCCQTPKSAWCTIFVYMYIKFLK